MKNRRMLLAALAILLAGLIGWKFFGVQSLPDPNRQAVPQPSSTAANRADVSPSLAVAQPTSNPASPPPKNRVDEMFSSPAGQARIQQFQQAIDAKNSKPINVYGKIIDQYGLPVAGAEVKAGTTLGVSFERSRNESFSAMTNAQGEFSFVGLHGMSFGFGVEKAGYEYDPRKYLGWWDSYKPDSQTPAVFTMWKLQGAEPMRHTQLNGRLPYDSRAGSFGASFDIDSGKVSSSGELRITLTQNPLVVRRGIDRYDWNIKIEMLGGGLVEATDPYKYLAPENGYEPAVGFSHTKDDPQWQDRLIRIFYVHTAQGQFGRVAVDVTSGSNRPDTGLGIGLSIEAWLNPSGSRNLEYDPLQNVAKPTTSKP